MRMLSAKCATLLTAFAIIPALATAKRLPRMESCSSSIVQPIGSNFWNLRQEFKVLKVIDVGTHMSLVKLSNGKFVCLDTIKLTPGVKKEIDSLTQNGELIESVIATHPFHTVYFSSFYKTYPNAKYYGTPRHLKVIKDVPWAGTIDDPSNVKKWQPELSFAVTPCCDYENADFDGSHHVMSVLAFHQPSKTLHIDDTFTYFNAPKKFPLNLLPIKTDDVLFNFNLKKILRNSKTPNAMLVYRDWYRNEVLNKWDIDNAVFAHDGVLLGGGKARFERLMNFFE